MDLFLIILITVLFSAFFSGMEIAFISANKLRIEIDKKQNIIYSKILTLFTRHPGQYIATMLVGNNIALVIYGIAFTKLLEPFLYKVIESSTLVLFIQTIISTVLILGAAEFLPKTLFSINPNSVLKLFAIPISLFYFLFYPITKITMGISRLILKVFARTRFENVSEKIVFSRIDLDHFIKNQHSGSSQSELESIENEVKLFKNALDFSKVKLREIMVPRTEIEAMDVNSGIEELKKKFIETGYSRILFYEDNIDNIVGYIHHSMIFNNPSTVKSSLHKILIVPETMPANKLLSKFIQQRLSIAVVVDEFGGTAGLVTSEDILEEIFGEIEDEHDTIDLIDKQISPNEFIFSARLELDDINEKYNLKFPVNENFETLAGFILFHYESLPKINTVILIDNYELKILKATNTKIELVHLKILDNT